MNPVKLLKKRFFHLLCAVQLGIEFFLLNPNRIMGVIALILSAVLSFVAFKLYGKTEAIRKHRIFSLSFFSSFLSFLSMEVPAVKSYEIASQYLTGYQEPIPYEEIIENPDKLSLYEFQDYFKRVIEMEKENEALLGDYSPLIAALEKEIGRLTELNDRKERELRNSLAFLLFFFFLVLILTAGNPLVSELLKTNFYALFCGFLLPFAYPSIIFFASKQGEKK